MSNRAILDVALRLMGIYFLVQAILLLPGLLIRLYRFDNRPHDVLTGAYLLSEGIQLAVFLLCSLLFLLRSGRSADPGAGAGTDGSPIADSTRLPAMIFSAVGVLIGSLAVADVFAPALYIATAPDEDVRTGLRYAEWVRLAAGVLQVLLGVFLFLSGSRLARSWGGRAET